ncbi:MAG: endonuclease/exonuclease/phosphatase family protein [Bacteroidales bacterium]|nr:endonuclease/exonuclease/phosphatase family protein [Bacteroidales bacterium]
MKRLLKILVWFFFFLWLLSFLGLLLPPTFIWVLSFLALFFPLIFVVALIAFLVYSFYNIKALVGLLIVSLSSFFVLKPLSFFPHKKTYHFSSDDTLFSVISHNVDIFKFYEKGAFIPEKWIKTYQQLNPHILCLQECFVPDTSKIFIHKNLLEPLSMSYYVYFPYLAIKDKGFAGMFIGSKFPILHHGIISNNTPEGKKIIAIWADLLLYEKDTMRVFNVHLQSYQFSQKERDFLDIKANSAQKSILINFLSKFRLNAYYRSLQAKKLLEFALTFPDEVIVMGDFNELPWSYICITFAKYFKDVYKITGTLNHFRTLNFALPLRVDYIFMKENKIWVPVSYQVIKENLNDHYPIQCIFAKNGK